jgi:pimeloyl-ACP methyl ester carboxylesterase
MPTVQSPGVPIYYELIGAGTPILLVHGFAGSFEDWGQSGWVDFLFAQGRKVVGMDCRGHGRSGKPHDPTTYDDPRMPDDILAVMDAAGLEALAPAAEAGLLAVGTLTLGAGPEEEVVLATAPDALVDSDRGCADGAVPGLAGPTGRYGRLPLRKNALLGCPSFLAYALNARLAD